MIHFALPLALIACCLLFPLGNSLWRYKNRNRPWEIIRVFPLTQLWPNPESYTKTAHSTKLFFLDLWILFHQPLSWGRNLPLEGLFTLLFPCCGFGFVKLLCQWACSEGRVAKLYPVVLCRQGHYRLFSLSIILNWFLNRSSQFLVFKMPDFRCEAIPGIETKKILWLNSKSCIWSGSHWE